MIKTNCKAIPPLSFLIPSAVPAANGCFHGTPPAFDTRVQMYFMRTAFPPLHSPYGFHLHVLDLTLVRV